MTLGKVKKRFEDTAFEYDVVVSGLAIHHLDEQGKQTLFKRVFRALNPGGVFFIREVVLGETPDLTKLYLDKWSEYIKDNEEDDKIRLTKHLEEDMPSTVDDQLTWLRQAGLTDVGCHWRYLNFAIFGGRKKW